MPQYWCVPACTNSKGGHCFPTEDPALHKKWRVAIKRTDPVTKGLWMPKVHDRVCADHFDKSSYYPTSCISERKRLLKDAIPTIFPFSLPSESSSAKRRRERRERKVTCNMSEEMCFPDVGNEVTVSQEEDILPLQVEDTDTQNENVHDAAVECHILTDLNSRLSLENMKDDPRAIQYYTGFDDYSHVMCLFNILGQAVFCLNVKCSLLSQQDQLFLALMKLRQTKEDVELSILFKISESTVSKLVNTWFNFLYFQLKEINMWPSKHVIQEHMPKGFGKQFKSTRVVLDATEVPISKPANVNAQSATFSTYKNKNTLKTMIGCTPRGLVSYVGDSYGGSASDRQLIERSPLIHGNMFDPKDSIMADRGILVQDLFSSKDVFVNTPTMLKGKSQLEPNEVVRDRRIASKRIHMERVIGLGKTFKILKKELQQSKRNMGSRIIYICFMLSNFRQSIVNKLA